MRCYSEANPEKAEELNNAFNNQENLSELERVGNAYMNEVIKELVDLVDTCDQLYSILIHGKLSIIEGLKEQIRGVSLDSINKVVQQEPTWMNYYDRTFVHLSMDNYSLAESDLKKVLELKPDNSGVQVILAIIAESKGDWKRAGQIYSDIYSETGEEFILLYHEAAKRAAKEQ